MRKRKIMRCAAILALLLPLLLAGCRQKPAEEPHWVREDYLLPAGWDPGAIQSCAGGTLSVIGKHLADEQVCLFTLAEGGGVLERQDLSAASRLSPIRWEGSTFYGIRRTDGGRFYERYAEDGTPLESVPLDGLTGAADFHPFDVFRQADGTLYLLSHHIAAVVPAEGDTVVVETNVRFELLTLFPAPNGEVWVWERTERGYGIVRVDVDAAKFCDLVFLPKNPEELENPLAFRDLAVLGFDAEGRFLWAEADGINAVVFGEDGVTRARLLDYDDFGLDVAKYAASLLSDGRTLVYRRREVENPPSEGESDEAYQARTGGARWLTKFVVLRRAG